MVHPNEQDIKQRQQEMGMDEQGAPYQIKMQKGSMEKVGAGAGDSGGIHRH